MLVDATPAPLSPGCNVVTAGSRSDSESVSDDERPGGRENNPDCGRRGGEELFEALALGSATFDVMNVMNDWTWAESSFASVEMRDVIDGGRDEGSTKDCSWRNNQLLT